MRPFLETCLFENKRSDEQLRKGAILLRLPLLA